MAFRDYIAQLNWYLVVITLLVFIGLCKLGFWQLSRAIEKEERLVRINTYQQGEHFQLLQVLKMSAKGEDINDIPVMVNGYFSPKFAFLLDNQVFQGKVGYRVLQVLKVDSQYVLINLGWIGAGATREDIPEFKLLKGFHEMSGHIRIIEPGLLLTNEQLTQQQWPLRIQTIDLNKISQNIGQKLLPFVIYLDTKEDIGYEKQWQPIVMPPEKHRGYAFQWFSLAIAWLILMLSASLYWARQNNNNNNKGEYV